jgi:uncharacterized protein YbcV (DUF1398 family)
MFTLDQIHEAHAKVKSGADFPRYVQDLIALGVRRYEHFVADGRIEYHGEDGFSLSSKSMWSDIAVADTSSVADLRQAITIHQQGQTDYITFCKQSGEAGVRVWVVDMVDMTCIYYNTAGEEMVSEVIPAP